MSRFLPFVAILFSLSLSLESLHASDAVTPFSSGWLNAACIEIHRTDGDTNDTEAIRALHWMDGFIRGTNSMMFAHEGGEKKIYFPPPEWKNPVKLASLLVKFFIDNPHVNPESSPQWVMAAFVYSEHPDSTEFHRAAAELFIDRAAKGE